jgi:hypothetical protein
MGKLLNFDDEKYEKGYKPFNPKNKDLVRANIGKKICYVDSVDRYRGYFSVKYGVIHSIKYSTLFLNDMERQVDIRDIKDCGIELSAVDKI